MRLYKALVATAVITASGGMSLRAQEAGDAPSVDPGYVPAVRYPDSSATFYDHSSTVAEGAARGVASVIRAAGAANLDHSLAAMNYQEAIRRSLENTLKYAETYYARRDLWYDYQEEHRRKPLTMEGYRRLAEAEGAARLRPDQFDPETGKVLWPDLLQAEVLEPYRNRIDEVLASRSTSDVDPGMGSKTYETVRQMTEAMQSVLDRARRSLPSHLYVDATQFLESVRFEARFAPPSNTVAAAEPGAAIDPNAEIAPPPPPTPAEAEPTEEDSPDSGAASVEEITVEDE